MIRPITAGGYVGDGRAAILVSAPELWAAGLCLMAAERETLS